MADRYVVMSIAEARASGKRASGFLSRARAESCAALLNSRPPGRSGRYASQAPRWWRVGESDTHAVVDTATTADGSPGESERRPCEGWRQNGPAGWALPLAPGGLMEAPLYAIVTDGRNGMIRWMLCAEEAGDDDKSVAFAKGASLPSVAAARLAAESAAAALLVDALLALGETGREAMRRAGEGRR